MRNFPSIESEIGEIVTADFRTAEIFKKNGIDFCCGGNMSLKDACAPKGLKPGKLIEELSKVMDTPDNSGTNYLDWELGFLIDYILNTHHQFVKKNLPQLREYTLKIANVHGDHHQELHEVARLFSEIDKELLIHLEKEEQLLFPSIKESLKQPSEDLRLIISSEINRMGGEHEFAGSAMDKIRQLTGNYLLPEDACNTFRLCYHLLEQFEDDLHVHVHLENNILFKQALQL